MLRCQAHTFTIRITCLFRRARPPSLRSPARSCRGRGRTAPGGQTWTLCTARPPGPGEPPGAQWTARLDTPDPSGSQHLSVRDSTATVLAQAAMAEVHAGGGNNRGGGAAHTDAEVPVAAAVLRALLRVQRVGVWQLHEVDHLTATAGAGAPVSHRLQHLLPWQPCTWGCPSLGYA